MTYKHIEVKPISGALGAEIFGVDLAEDLEDAVIREIRTAFLDHGVVFFRDQDLTPERHKAFARRLGELSVHPYVKPMDDHPEVIEIVKDVDDKHNFGGSWHSDLTYTKEPALGSILLAKETPSHGGDTMFASMTRAYETLSDGMKAMLNGVRAVNSASKTYGARARATRFRGDLSAMQVDNLDSTEQEELHPVLRTHPETGRKAIYVNKAHTIRFEDMTEEESTPILEHLYEHATRPEFTCRFRWEVGSIAFWDNRCVQHKALNDYHGQRRAMQRVTIVGDEPF